MESNIFHVLSMAFDRGSNVNFWRYIVKALFFFEKKLIIAKEIVILPNNKVIKNACLKKIRPLL